jgi:hypothetical protein
MRFARLARTAAAATVVAATVTVPATMSAAGNDVGVYPTRVNIDSAFRGGEYLKTIGVIAATGSAVTFVPGVSGSIAPWVSFVDVNDPTRAVADLRVRGRGQVGLRVKVPATAADGTYAGIVHLVSEPLAGVPASGGSNQGVRVGADVAVSVVVDGTQVVRGRFLDSYAPNAIEAGYPLRMKNVVANDGNVGVRPRFDVTISHGGRTVATSGGADAGIEAGSRKTIETDWQSGRGSDIGPYIAHVVASFNGVSFGSRDVRFEVVPYGSLRRAGTFEGLTVLNHPKPGEAAHVQAIFRNTGQIETNVVFDGAMRRGSHTVRAVTSAPAFADVGTTRTFDFYVNVKGGGQYALTGHLTFEGRDTATRTAAFSVPSAGMSTTTLFALIAAGVIAALLVGRAIRARGRRRLRRRPGAAAAHRGAVNARTHRTPSRSPSRTRRRESALRR